MEIAIKVNQKELKPSYATERAAGADLRADIDKEIELLPGTSALVSTGIFLEIPEGCEAQIRPRSGLALNYQITILNTPGTIDADYRGEIKVILINHGKVSFFIKPKMRIAQMVFAPIYQVEFVEKEELIATMRGSEGFGHTGTN